MTDQKWYLSSGEELVTGTITSINEKNGTAKATGVKYVCWRCNGSGRYPSICYDGICLKCEGRRELYYKGAKTVYTADALADRLSKQAAKQAEKNAARMAEQAREDAKVNDAFIKILEENEWLKEAISIAETTKNSFMIDVIDSVRKYGRLSEKQAAVLQKNIANAKDAGKQQELALNAGFIGKEGERVEIRAKIATKRFLEGCGFQGAGTYLYKFVSHDGAIICTFTDRELGAPHEELLFKATVKKHETFKNLPQTIVTRVAVQ
jgi:hypothetical protein